MRERAPLDYSEGGGLIFKGTILWKERRRMEKRGGIATGKTL